MKESITLTLKEVEEFLQLLSEQWPIKCGVMYQQVQQFFVKKFEDSPPSTQQTIQPETVQLVSSSKNGA